MRNKKLGNNTSSHKETLHFSHSFIHGMLGGVLGSVLILGSYTLLVPPSHLLPISQGLRGDIATLDRDKIMKYLADKIGKRHLSPKDLEGELKDSLIHLDKLITDFEHEKGVVLLNQEAVASLNAPDYTDEIIMRLNKKEISR